MKRIGRIAGLLLALLLLTGCSGLSYQDLYTLPRASEDYYDLQEALNWVLSRGYSYAAPVSGARREPVQLVDLNADGVDEAVAFFRSGETGTVTIYILARNAGVYTPSTVVEGAGPAVASVEYVDLDGTDDMEIIFAYQVSDAVPQAIQVYHYTGSGSPCILSGSCTRYRLSDLDGDGLQELICLTGGADSTVAVECFDYLESSLISLGEQRLRFGYDGLRQTLEGKLDDGTGALLFSGVSPEGTLMTDVLTVEAGGLVSIEPQENILSSQAIHSNFVYPRDVDGDGRTDIPVTRQLPAYDDGSAPQSVVDWYALRSGGQVRKKMTVFQAGSESWYLEILDAWDQGLTVKCLDESAAVSTVTLARHAGGETPQDILTIYTLRGASRQEYAAEHSLTALYSDSDTIYAVSLAAAELWEGTASLAQVSELFHYTGSSQPETEG